MATLEITKEQLMAFSNIEEVIALLEDLGAVSVTSDNSKDRL